MISSHSLSKCQDLIPTMVIIWLKSRINLTYSLQCKSLTITWLKLKMQLTTSSVNTKNKNSCGRKLFNKTSKLSLMQERISTRVETRRSTPMEKKRKTKPSSGWLIRFYKVSKLKSLLSNSSMRRLLTSQRSSTKSQK